MKTFFLLLFSLGFINLYSQNPQEENYFDINKRFSLSVFGEYISSAELQNNPKSEDPIARDATIDMNGGYGYGAEFIYDPGIYNSGIKFYLSTEYYKADQNDLEITFDDGPELQRVRLEEEYKLIPIEFGVKWNLPVSSENLKIYIGGGGGVYFGDRTRHLGGMQSSTITKKPGFSLNILSGIEYYIGRNISADFEFKFREPSFDVESKFSSDEIVVNGTPHQITNPFYSRIIVDGVRLSLGVNYHF